MVFGQIVFNQKTPTKKWPVFFFQDGSVGHRIVHPQSASKTVGISKPIVIMSKPSNVLTSSSDVYSANSSSQVSWKTVKALKASIFAPSSMALAPLSRGRGRVGLLIYTVETWLKRKEKYNSHPFYVRKLVIKQLDVSS